MVLLSLRGQRVVEQEVFLLRTFLFPGLGDRGDELGGPTLVDDLLRRLACVVEFQ